MKMKMKMGRCRRDQLTQAELHEAEPFDALFVLLIFLAISSHYGQFYTPLGISSPDTHTVHFAPDFF